MPLLYIFIPYPSHQNPIKIDANKKIYFTKMHFIFMSMQIQFIKQFFILKQHHFHRAFLMKADKVHIHRTHTHIHTHLYAFKHNNTQKYFLPERNEKKGREKCY